MVSFAFTAAVAPNEREDASASGGCPAKLTATAIVVIMTTCLDARRLVPAS